MQQLLGILALIVALVALVFYLRTSYLTEGGCLGQNPCIAAATIQVPMMTFLGLALLHGATGHPDLPWWLWIVLWILETAAVAALAIGVGHITGRRRAKARLKNPSPAVPE